MDKKLRCPMRMTTVILDDNGESLLGVKPYCLKERCAWWNEDKQKCAIAVTPQMR